MSLKLISNQLFQQSARLLATDTAGTESDTTLFPENCITGPRHLYWGPGSTSDRRLVYVNMSGGIGIDTLIVSQAYLHAGYGLKVMSWGASYPASGTTHVTEASLSTFIGPGSQDYIYEFSPAISSKYAVGIELTGVVAKRIGKIYGGTALTFSYPVRAQFSPAWSSVMLARQPYLVEHSASFVFENVSRSTVQSLERLYKAQHEPVFFYDSAGTVIAEKLWHGLITNLKISPAFDDLHIVQIETMRLRHYS